MRLTWREKSEVYQYQVWVRAVKVCEMCGQTLRVQAFEHWGAQPCWECAKQLKRQRRAGWDENPGRSRGRKLKPAGPAIAMAWTRN